MKVFQIVDRKVHWDASTLYPSAEEASKHYTPDTIFVDAPDYVFESWFFNSDAEGDARFIRPVPPEGWGYNEENGCFYPLDGKNHEGVRIDDINS